MSLLNRRTHSRLWQGGGVREANDRLMTAVANGVPIVHGGRKLICTQCHYGPGLWRKDFGVSWDTHDDLQIQVAVTGKYDFEIEGRKVLLGPGGGLAIASRKPHIWKTSTGGFMLGLFVRALSPDDETETIRLRGDRSFALVKPPCLQVPLSAVLGLTARKQFTEFDSARLHSWLSLLIVEMLSPVLEAEPPAGDQDHGGRSLRHALVVRNVVEQIQRRISETLHIGDLARDAGVSTRHLNRIFAQFKGESIHRFIVQQRVLKARNLIEKDPDLPIKAVALESGFADASHLGNAFRRNFHISPGRFAESMRR